MDYIRKMVKSLIAGYVITLLMLGLLTYFMRKFILDEKAVDNIIFGIYVAGSFTGAMLSAWMIKKRRVVIGIIYGAVYITVLLVIAAIMKKQAPDSSNNIAMSVAACIAVAIGCSFYIGFLNGQPEAMPQLYSNLSGKSKVLLPDGSEVWMHTETSLQYGSQMNKDERIVNVTGEAYFDVAHDADKPFIVQTEGMRIVVHGTKFNVDAFPGSENTLVSLVEGSVSLETETENRFLKPGETATFNRKTLTLKVEKDDVHFASSWANTQLVFRNRSLGDICKLLSKWYRIKIDVDPTLSNKYFYTFTLRSEPLDEILRIMARIQPMKYTFNEENELTISFADTKQKVK